MSAVDTPRRERISVAPPTVASATRSRWGEAPTTPASRPAPPPIHVAGDGFLSEAQVDGWVRTGAAARSGCLLTAHDGRRFLLRDAVRVLGRRNGDTDPYGFTGRVETIRDFIHRGANVSADALRLGQAVYDIEYGFVASAL